MPVVTSVSGVQYSGSWSLSSVANAAAQANWPGSNVLYVWGLGTSGQLGLGNTTSYSSPKQVGSYLSWAAIAGGSVENLAIKTDGTLWAWGANTYGGLGLDNRTSYSSPKQVGALTNWSKVTSLTEGLSTVAVKTDGTLWSWGYNSAGPLGLGNQTNYSSPKQVGALTNWSQIAGGSSWTMAVKTNGTLWTWGYNYYGQLGQGGITDKSSPVQVGALTDWSKIATNGGVTAAAIKTDGTLWTWGLNNSGQLGLNDRTTRYSPNQVGTLSDWSTISTGANSHMIATKTDGTLWTWGQNAQGQLGLGNTTYYSSPKQVGTLTTWRTAYAGDGFSVAVKTDGTLWAFGVNTNGELGIGNITKYSSPKQVGTLTTWRSLVAGKNGVIALGGF